jgi:hypothetical protein
MRLLHRLADGSVVLTKEYRDQKELPDYATLSHTWSRAEHDEVTYDDMTSPTTDYQSKLGYRKILFCSEQAYRDGIDYTWCDTCCIDKNSSQDLSEAIQTMFTVTAADMSAPATEQQWTQAFKSSKWHTRGWCLQELLAPTVVEFYSAEGNFLGSKHDLQELITEASGVPREALYPGSLAAFTVDQRLAWAEHRETLRTEDRAYCLLGIFDVHMPFMYGEGSNAWDRLHEEIRKKTKVETEDLRMLGDLPSVPFAAFNSRDAGDFSVCLPNTRVELLKDVSDWIESHDERCIFWLSGSAGTGKSTVARTIAQKYHDKGYLGGSFFFSRGGGDASRADDLLTTLASQLAAQVPAAVRHISNAIQTDRDLLHKNLREQWDRLIIAPLAKLTSDLCPPVILFVLDALDECDSEKDTRTVLRLLGMTKQPEGLNRIRVRIFITSRPETHIRWAFQQIPPSERRAFVLHDIPSSIVNRDITLFFEDNFNDLRKERGWDKDFPDDATISRLVNFSCGLFIWASTACLYIRDGKQMSRKRITKLINQQQTGREEPTRHLDELYATVLRDCVPHNADEKDRQEACEGLRKVLGSIVSLFSPLPPSALGHLLVMPSELVSETLVDLHAIFNISEQDDTPIRLHHLTFRDFLLDKTRCTDNAFWVDKNKAHAALGRKCIEIMSKMLKQNICGVSSPGIRIGDISPAHIKKCIPLELEYACLYWAEHIRESGENLSDDDHVHIFLQEHFLHWCEAIALLKKCSEMGPIMRMYRSMLIVRPFHFHIG